MVCANVFVNKSEDVVKGKGILPLASATLGVKV
jgi:hypothetical protein